MTLIENDYVIVEVPAFVQRALNVATSVKKQLLIVTSDPAFEQLIDTAKHGVTIQRPCPCGYFGSGTIKCRCEPAQIEKHQYTIRETFGNNWLRVDGSFCARNIKYKQLDSSCLMLLKHAIKELNLSIYQILLITDVAGAIAKMDEAKVIGPEHVAEAISYRMI